MSVETKDVRVDQRYQVDLKTPNTKGQLAAPAAGTVTGILCRLSATPFGSAIDPAVDNLAATEAAAMPGRFYVDVDTAVSVAKLLPLGVGTSYYAIWKKAGDMDNQSVEFRVGDGTVVT